ncbi:hypothetical protein OIU78_005581 [Salix suchowensis]|nr:hypothetical protein OIU78_005581 [Salix suchowensis]
MPSPPPPPAVKRPMYGGSSSKGSSRETGVGERETWKGLRGDVLVRWWGFCTSSGAGEDLLGICFEAQLFCTVIVLLFARL